MNSGYKKESILERCKGRRKNKKEEAIL